MKLFLPSGRSPTSVFRRQQGMTLVEMMFTIAIMSVVIAGIMSAHFLGLREDQLMESKAGANDMARRSITQLLNDIRAAKGYDIGNMSGVTNFSAITNGGALQGAGLRLYMIVLSTNQAIDPNKYTLYYFDTSQLASGNGKLWRMTSTNGLSTVVASNLINTMQFTSEDYLGTTQHVRTFKGVVHTTLEFCQFQYPLTPVGTNGLYDYYRIDCRATPHLPDGI